ncbi:(2Z,6Z)-farnesyl diphosphate synthase CPT6, chloroplastic-like isoform X2 [Andrographis paniculata]|uniref:(2Z,6Z)-farnesyl diphosphate synthase CPT6, chloroplastic-like isoform X2 n=1 Tax=Andrographis paniculata TaxID=175694 RepID=UPI0021E98364|nr:(2Z,6Z)-farnesyl diphosphate synthase CPT6, chloroplastic-like isoform X2 [Andrographis paniculata]
MPKHVAVILDGNRRWAKARGFPVELGHVEGKRVMMEIAFLSCKWDVKVLSLFCFSTENWSRPQEEVDNLMTLLEEVVQTYLVDFFSYNIRISVMGDRAKLPESLIKVINMAEENTKGNKGLHILIAINYSGQYDIVKATKNIVLKVKSGIVEIEDINKSLIEEELETSCAKYPIPDLLIRTSGEQRISNFMLWQMAYTELVFSKKMFPEFEEQDYVEALLSFQKRDRRFGGKKY